MAMTYPGSSAIDAVDDLDLRIIGALQEDGRRAVVEIARDLGVPKSTVQRRLDALIRDEVIRIAAYADSEKLGLGIHVHFNLRLDLSRYQEAIDEIAQLIEVRWLAVTTGPSDVVAEAYFASPTHLDHFIRTRLSAITGITSVETAVILSVEKLAFHWDALIREAAEQSLPHVRMNGNGSGRGAKSVPDSDGARVL
jgi:DNA-binding Lrp family transcriptional regulator